jgi:outer membrane receptor for ferrienterochelin and colicins
MTSILRGRYDLRGNPDLQPEESTSGELAVGHRFERGRVEVVAHRAHVSNLIASVPTGARGPGCGATPTPDTSCQIQAYRNVGKAVVQGVEASGQYRLADSWSLEGALEYLNARDGNSNARLTDRPTWLGKLALRWRRDRWQADLRLRHTHHWYAADPALVGGLPFTSNYTVSALRLAYGLDAHSELHFGVDNLANRLPPANQTSRGTPDDPGARFIYAGYAGRF